MDVVKDPGNEKEEILIRLVNQYQGMLLRMCYVYLKDMEQAKDAAQETFLKVYNALPGFRGQCSEKSWLMHIAINTCRDMRRSAWFRHMDRRITPEDLPLSAMMPADEEDLDVMCHIMRLPPKQKEVILLYYWQDMNVTEIAQSLGIAQSSVSNRLKRARDFIRKELERRDSHE